MADEQAKTPKTAALFGNLGDVGAAAQAVSAFVAKADGALNDFLTGKSSIRVTMVDSGVQLSLIPGPGSKTAAWEA